MTYQLQDVDVDPSHKPYSSSYLALRAPKHKTRIPTSHTTESDLCATNVAVEVALFWATQILTSVVPATRRRKSEMLPFSLNNKTLYHQNINTKL